MEGEHFIHNKCDDCRSGMKIWLIKLSSGPVHVHMRRMKIATLNPIPLTTLERALQPLPATLSTTLN